MEILCHRGCWKNKNEQNTWASFKKALELNFGIETDVRDKGNKLVISHDPPSGESILFEDFIKLFSQYRSASQSLAINIKSDGLAQEIKKLIKHYKIYNYFTFDMSIPEMIKYKKSSLNYFSTLSEYEKEITMSSNSKGIWLDAFESEWYNQAYIDKLIKTVNKICIVSAELHNRDNKEQWEQLRKYSQNAKIMLCTDQPGKAKEYFK